MASINQQLARRFEQMAEVTEVTGGNRFRVNAFHNTARMLGEMTEDVSQLDEKQLTELHGIGKGNAQRIREFVETGRIAEHEKMMAEVPNGILDLLDIPNLGPKTVAQLWREAGVTDLATLKEKLNTGELTELKGFGQKKQDQLKKNIAFAESAGERVNIGQALPLAQWFVDQLSGLKSVKQVDYAGSLRRGRETIGDLDLLVAAESRNAKKISESFTKLDPVEEVLLSGATKTSVRTSEGIQVDLRIVEAESYGAALMYFTGSKEHNVALRGRANDMGCKLSEYGLFEEDTDKLIAGKTEQDVYHALKLAWIPPELREDHGEIEMAARSFAAGSGTKKSSKKKTGKSAKKKASKPAAGKSAAGGRGLPELIEPADIKAELHAHTTASDGHWSIEEYAKACAERGFHTCAVTDHSKSQVQANGLNAKRLEQHIEAIREAADKLKGTIQILAGSEVDILADGKLDYPDSLLAELDIVVASPHAALQQDAEKATRRLLKGIENPYVTILGHPTGRIVNKREGLKPDMSKLIDAAAERGIALEINANHHRLDLRDSHARSALAADVKLAIDTDAHGPADLDELGYGVLTARRAGATKDDVINCFSKQALAKWIQSTRP
jgi:DNA polymerase (family 10)